MRTRGFSLAEVLLSLAILSFVLLTMLVVATWVPGALAQDRLVRAGNLLRSQLERYRALPLSDQDWEAGARQDDFMDSGLRVSSRVSVWNTRRDLLLRVLDLQSGQILVSGSLTRTEGGL